MKFRVCSFSSSICNCWMDNLRPVCPLGEKWRIIDWEGQRVACGKPAHPRL
jgi:hypothetical protein